MAGVITVGSSAKPRRVPSLGVLLHGASMKALVVFEAEAGSFRSMPSPVPTTDWDMP
jgi:hypothetical protein